MYQLTGVADDWRCDGQLLTKRRELQLTGHDGSRIARGKTQAGALREQCVGETVRKRGGVVIGIAWRRAILVGIIGGAEWSRRVKSITSGKEHCQVALVEE